MRRKELLQELRRKSSALDQVIVKSEGRNTGLIRKIYIEVRQLLLQLRALVGRSELYKALGTCGVLFLPMLYNGSAQAQTFEGPKNAFNIPKAYYYAFLEVADLDGDGDYDVLVGDYYNGLKFYENDGTPEKPEFLVPQVNPFGFESDSYLIAPRLVDIDNDGDLDLFSLEYEEMRFFENIGDAQNPEFQYQSKNPVSGIAFDYMEGIPEFADIDGDEDYDLINYGNEELVSIFENRPQNGVPKIDSSHYKEIKKIEFQDSTYLSYQFVDFDNDGDLDLISCNGYEFFFTENKGKKKKLKIGKTVNLSSMGVKPAEYITNFRFADMDNDGDLDFFYSVYEYGEIYYYENTSK